MKILDHLKHLYESRTDEVDSWLAHQRQQSAPYIYTSVDLRHAGHRLVPVDANLFPAGFNNLSPAASKRAVQYFKQYFAQRFPEAKRVALIAENHTRNLAYLHNLYVLQDLITQAGFEVRIGSMLAKHGEPLALKTSQDKNLTQYALRNADGTLELDNGFVPDMVVLNHDLSGGVPEVLQGISQPICPSPDMGWHRRRKSAHFAAYQQLAESFGNAFSLDPWLISAGFHACGMIDFKAREGLDCLAESIDRLIECAKKKHAEHGIEQEPYIYVKADSGTYGMGIMCVRDASDILEMNKKERNKMHKIKEGQQVSDVIIQEGIPTVDTVDKKPAEPMIYLVDGKPAGGMFRVNGGRNSLNNLNAAGMEFTGMCDEAESLPGAKAVKDCHFRSFGLIASISALAAAREDYSQPVRQKACEG